MDGTAWLVHVTKSVPESVRAHFFLHVVDAHGCTSWFGEESLLICILTSFFPA